LFSRIYTISNFLDGHFHLNQAKYTIFIRFIWTFTPKSSSNWPPTQHRHILGEKLQPNSADFSGFQQIYGQIQLKLKISNQVQTEI